MLTWITSAFITIITEMLKKYISIYVCEINFVNSFKLYINRVWCNMQFLAWSVSHYSVYAHSKWFVSQAIATRTAEIDDARMSDFSLTKLTIIKKTNVKLNIKASPPNVHTKSLRHIEILFPICHHIYI